MDADTVEVCRGYGCHVLPVDYSLSPDDVPDPNGDPYFTLKFIRDKRYYEVPHLDQNSGMGNVISILRRRISENTIEQTTQEMLSDFDIPQPDHHVMATKILDAAGNMLNNTHRNDKILNLVVYIGIFIYYRRDNDDYNRTLEASMEEHQDNNNGLVPASDSSIEGLPRVELEQVQGSRRHCVICLRAFKVGREIIRMPCSHFFHRSCIVPWLHRKNECPLCRFRMPTSDGH